MGVGTPQGQLQLRGSGQVLCNEGQVCMGAGIPVLCVQDSRSALLLGMCVGYLSYVCRTVGCMWTV